MGVRGRGGRPPKLREVKKLHGTWRKDREPANVPSAEHAVPEMPPDRPGICLQNPP